VDEVFPFWYHRAKGTTSLGEAVIIHHLPFWANIIYHLSFAPLGKHHLVAPPVQKAVKGVF